MPLTLGIHLGHDRSATIVKDGVLHAHIAEERLDRIKHSPFLKVPFLSIDALLKASRLKITDFAAIGATYTDIERPTFLSEIKDQLEDHYSVAVPSIVSLGHHHAHALSAFHTSDFKDAVVLVADGSGDSHQEQKEAESWYMASHSGIQLIARRLQQWAPDIYDNPSLYLYPLMNEKERAAPLSLGHKYEQFSSLLGFGRHQEGTTMALAAYGRPLVDVRNYEFGKAEYSLTRGDILDAVDALRKVQGLSYSEFVRRERKNLAATIQRFIEHAIISILLRLRKELTGNRLCLAGGIFLNCALNQRILERRIFEKVHVVPTAGDDGQSIGAAFHAYNVACGRPANGSSPLPFLGLSHSMREIRHALIRHRLSYVRHSGGALAKRVVNLLLDEKIVGVLRGRSEAGPRALCHRSLLADPRSRDLKDRLNLTIKRREMFRPFAPVVTAEDQDKYFRLNQKSPFMVLAGQVRRKYRSYLHGITHVDGTARVQSISEKDDPFIYGLLKLFEKETGFPILLNTSFNGRGEPIVEGPDDAIKTSLRMSIDILVMENYLVEIVQGSRL
jgi:carbamoyltransferase